jgi:hypothetical protein
MNYENFRADRSREFEAWKQQRQQQQQQQQPPRAQVGEAIQSLDRLRVGDIFQRNSNRPRRRILSITPTGVTAQRVDSNGNLTGTPRDLSLSSIRDHKVTEHGDTGPRVGIGGKIENPEQLRPGDFIQNEQLVSEGRLRKILEVLPNGDLKTQRVDAQTGRDYGRPQTTPRTWITREAPHDAYSQYERVVDPTAGRAERERQERERREQQREQQRRERAEREERERLERLDREREERRERPHIPVGDTLEQPRQLRVGDFFSNAHLRSLNQHREVVTIKPNGQVISRIMNDQGEQVAAPTVLEAALFRQHGPYKRTIGAGHVISSPGDVGPGSYVAKGDKTYRVVHRTPTALHLQDVHEGRGVGRPTKVRKADLEGGDYKIAVSPRQAETGHRLKSFSDVRVGQVVRAMHHRTPKWVRVKSIGADKIKVQPVNAQTGDDEGEAEELSKTDLKQWAYLTNPGNLPEVLLPPLETPPGGFAEPGHGELTINQQPGRYDDIRITLTGATEASLSRLLGPKAAGKNPKHVIADLAGAGGMAKSLKTLYISVDGNTVHVSGDGDNIRDYSRNIHFSGDGSPNRIYNSHFRLRESAPKQMGLRCFATQVAAAREFGFGEIGVQAAGNAPFQEGTYNGYYVWPRFGYDKAFPSNTFHDMPRSIQDAIREIRPGAPRGLRFLDVMEASQEARDWWRDHGREQNMTFDLSEGSRNLEYLTKYVQEVPKDKHCLGADQFLNRAASKKDTGKGKDDLYEWYPTFGPEEEEISDRIWDAMGAETRKKNKKKKRKKKATQNLVDLATDNDVFRKLLLTELKKGES